MRFGSVCSGIESASVAWGPLGWRAAFVAEIEKAPCAVLAQHYPNTPNLGDITKFQDWPDAALDLLVGGTPCQSFSVAGLRKGLADPRGNLALTYLGIVDRYRPEWCIWENVPGVLSVDGGRAFGAFLGGLAELGYGFAYRILDAQFVRVDGFGRAVPQRRRRVFVVGNSRSWRRAAAVLFEPESLSWDSPPRREAGKGIAPTISSRPTGGGGLGTDFDLDGGLVARCVTAREGQRQDYETETLVAHALRADGFDASEDGTGRGTPLVACPVADTLTVGADQTWGRPGGEPVAYSITPSNSNTDYNARKADKAQALTGNGNRPTARGGDLIAFDTTQITSPISRANPKAGDPCHTLSKGMHPPTIAFTAKDHGGDAAVNVSPTLRSGAFDKSHANAGVMPAIAIQERAVSENLENGPQGKGYQEGIAYTLEARNKVQAVAQKWAVRRLTPLECERLQGFPDGYTLIPYRGKPMADGPRYKMLGNSKAVNAIRWIGKRIQMVAALNEAEAA